MVSSVLLCSHWAGGLGGSGTEQSGRTVVTKVCECLVLMEEERGPSFRPEQAPSSPDWGWGPLPRWPGVGDG